MDYEGNIRQSFTIPTADFNVGDFVYLYSDGYYEIVTDEDFNEANYNTLEMLMGYCANYSNRVINRTPALVSVGYKVFTNDIIFINTNRIDYAVYGSSAGNNTLVGEQFLEGDSLDDLSAIDNYYHSVGYASMTEFNDPSEYNYYGRYDLGSFSGYAVFDYNNLKYDNQNDSFYVVRGENTAFYNVVNEFYYSANAQNIYYYFGDPIASKVRQAEETAYNNGFQAGWVQGNANGFTLGQNSGGVTAEVATPFSYIGTAFNSVGNLLSIEILPNVTLGLCFSIPMTFLLIMTIFKLVRK